MAPIPSSALVEWFSTHQRGLPWRREYSPYHVWVSEIMAQQTRIEQMLPYYDKFLQKFPTIHALASADEQAVLKAWEGLGYYSRARNLHAAAKVVVKNWGGKLPSTRMELQTLSGFGPYISAAVASIAFNEDCVVVDGNVLRVAARFFGIRERVSLPATRKKIEELLLEHFPTGRARDFNQGLMELGALVCVPDNPACGECPLQKGCFARANGAQDQFPVKAKKGKVPVKHFAMVRVARGDNVALIQRDTKLLHGLWEYPSVEFSPLIDSAKAIEQKLAEKYGGSFALGKNTGEATHQYSHFTQVVHVFEAIVKNAPTGFYFLTPNEMRDKPLTKIQSKILDGR